MINSRQLSIWYIVAIPVIAGLSTLDLRLGGLNYTGFIWAVMLVAGLFLLAVNRLSGFSARGIMPCWPWFVWCGFVFLSLLWCQDLTRRNIQDALQLSLPVVVALLAASAMRTHDDLRRLFVSFGVALGLLSMFTIAYVLESFDRQWMSTNMRGAAMLSALVGCVFLAFFPRRKLLPLAGWGACLLITTLTSSRIATLALLVAPMIHPSFRGRLVWKGLAICASLAVGLFLFNTQVFQQHFFESGHGTIWDLFSGDIKDLGRFDAWTAVWDRAWKRPLLGAGVGSTYTFVPQFWDGINHVHNDYLRVFYEQGLVGLAIFLAVMAWQLWTLRRAIAATDGIVRSAFTAAQLGFCAMLISCLTDNTLVYTVLFTNPLFALMGAAYGAAWAERHAAAEAAVSGNAVPQEVSLRPRFKNRQRAASAGLLGPNATGLSPQ